MRRSIVSVVAAVVVSTAFVIAIPAAATEISEAVQLCKKNPSCSQTKGPGGVNIKVGNNEIWCPNNGPCECLLCSPPKRIEGVAGPRPGVAGVLTSSTGKPSRPGGLFGTGILDNGPGFPSQGPTATGSPRAPSAPPVILR